MPDVDEGHVGIMVVTFGHGADECLDLGKEDRIVIFGLLIVSVDVVSCGSCLKDPFGCSAV